MGSDKKTKKPENGGGGFKWSSAMIWAVGQWAVCWFITYDALWATISAMFSAFFAGWTTSALLGRFARWGANPPVMMLFGVLLGVAVFSGAFSGIAAVYDWWDTRKVNVDWPKLQAFLLSWAVLPPAALGLVTGLYVRAKTPVGSKK